MHCQNYDRYNQGVLWRRSRDVYRRQLVDVQNSEASDTGEKTAKELLHACTTHEAITYPSIYE